MGRFLLFASMVAVALSTGQFQSAVFSDLDTGHWETDGPGVDPHTYAHHDHEHIHDHAHDHHPQAAHHPHHHHLTMDGEVLHHCEGDGTQPMEAACLCHQDNGLFQQICREGQFCDHFTGRCQQRSCFDACRFANPGRDGAGEAARDACYDETCNCNVGEGRSEEQKCQLECADCGPFPVQWPESPEKKASNHESVMNDIFGAGLEHGSDYNVHAMRPLETLSNIFF